MCNSLTESSLWDHFFGLKVDQQTGVCNGFNWENARGAGGGLVGFKYG